MDEPAGFVMPSFDQQKEYIRDNCNNISIETKKAIALYIKNHDAEIHLKDCAKSIAFDLNKLAEMTIRNIYVMIYNELASN